MVDLSARIGKMKIDPALMNASGIFSHLDILRKFSNYFGASVTKSIGIEPRAGFMEPIEYHDDIMNLNAVGLSNPGYKEMITELEENRPFPNKVICDIFGGTEDELVEIATGLEKYCSGFELNFGCPNLRKGEKHGMIIGKDPELVRRYTKAVTDNVKKPVIVKLTPNVDSIDKMIETAQAAEGAEADAIGVINTVYPGMKIDIHARKPVLTNKFGGVSGPAVKPIGVAYTYALYENLKIPIIGIGGIRLSTPEDFIEYAEAGAVAGGIGTYFVNKSTEKSIAELKEFKTKVKETIKDLGFSSLKDLVGAAHESQAT